MVKRRLKRKASEPKNDQIATLEDLKKELREAQDIIQNLVRDHKRMKVLLANYMEKDNTLHSFSQLSQLSQQSQDDMGEEEMNELSQLSDIGDNNQLSHVFDWLESTNRLSQV